MTRTSKTIVKIPENPAKKVERQRNDMRNCQKKIKTHDNQQDDWIERKIPHLDQPEKVKYKQRDSNKTIIS